MSENERRGKLITGGRVLDESTAEPRYMDVVVDGDTISRLKLPEEPLDGDYEIVDAVDRLLIPGLVNSHTHGSGALAKGLGDRWTLELLLNANPWMVANRTIDDLYLTAALGAIEMVRKGCTACYDLFFEFPKPTVEGITAVGRAYADVGMRSVVAPMMADRTLFQAVPGLIDVAPEDLRERVGKMTATPYEESIAACRDLLKAWKLDRDGIRLALGPTIALHCSDEFLLACKALSEEFGVGLHTHVAEAKSQAVSSLKRYGKTMTAHLADLELIGPNFVAAHSIWLDDTDIKRLADAGASVAHNPTSNMRLGSGLAAIRKMLEAGINVGIGTDACNGSDNLNMFESMRVASYVSRVQGAHYERWLTSHEVFQMATRGSARALGLEGEVGRLEPGYKADIVLLDLNHVNYVPLNNAVTQLVHVEDGCGIDSVMIGGRMVLDCGTITTVDETKIFEQARAAAARLAEANQDIKAFSDALADVIGAYCVGLVQEPYHVHRHARCTPI